MARMKRNANGSGCIRKRSDGRWEGIYSTAEVDGAGMIETNQRTVS